MGLSCASMLHKWETMVSGSNQGWCEIDVWPYLEDMAGDVISRTAFGSSHEEGTRIFQLQRQRFQLTLQLLPLSIFPGWRSNSLFITHLSSFTALPFIRIQTNWCCGVDTFQFEQTGNCGP